MKKLLLIYFSFACYSAEAQQPLVFKQKAFTLTRFLGKNHYKPLLWNDTSSSMLYDQWMGHLDKDKLFFTQGDIAILQPYQSKLDDELLGKEWKFFDLSLNIYRRRVKQADSIIQLFLTKPVDFTGPDHIMWPCKNYAANEQEMTQRWQQFLKWRILEEITDDFDDKQSLKTELPADFAKKEVAARQQVKRQELHYIKELFGSSPQAFTEDMQDAYLNSIAWCYDPHTDYMNLKAKKEFETEMSASEYSVGFDYDENEKGDKVVGFLQPGGSAWRSGKLHSGDVLVKIKVNGVETNVEDIAADELDGILGGNSETDVEITVRTTAGEQKTVRLVKEKISSEESIVKSYVLHGNRNIGYINLPGFYSRESGTIENENDIKYDGCANDVSKEIVKLKKDTIAGLILDLRYNGGGSMWEAMQLAGIFIDIGPVASMKEKDGKIHFLKDPNRGTIYDGPMIVLVNGASASASEFLSAALQDYNRAIIVGGTTYGKGTAQIVVPMDTGIISENKNYTDFVKVTERKFYRVNGSTVQWKGVVPDIALPDIYAGDEFREKSNKSALQPDNAKMGIYETLRPLPVEQLKIKSATRVASSVYFSSISNFSNWMNKVQEGQDIPLQWAGYTAYTNKVMEMFAQLKVENEEKKIPSLNVSNNIFDNERINQSSTKSKEINNVYIKHVQADRTLEEAYKIMMDWIEK